MNINGLTPQQILQACSEEQRRLVELIDKRAITTREATNRQRHIFRAIRLAAQAEAPTKAPEVPIDDAGRARSIEVRKRASDDHALWVLSKCRELGAITKDGDRLWNYERIARAFNARGLRTPRGALWDGARIGRALQRVIRMTAGDSGRSSIPHS